MISILSRIPPLAPAAVTPAIAPSAVPRTADDEADADDRRLVRRWHDRAEFSAEARRRLVESGSQP